MCPAKAILILALRAYKFKTCTVAQFLLSNFDKHDKMQIFAKLKNIF